MHFNFYATEGGSLDDYIFKDISTSKALSLWQNCSLAVNKTLEVVIIITSNFISLNEC